MWFQPHRHRVLENIVTLNLYALRNSQEDQNSCSKHIFSLSRGEKDARIGCAQMSENERAQSEIDSKIRNLIVHHTRVKNQIFYPKSFENVGQGVFHHSFARQ